MEIRYEVLLRWRSDATYAAPSLHSAVLEADHTSFINVATTGFDKIASRDRTTHVARAQGRSLAQVPPAAADWDARPPAWLRGGGAFRRAARGRGRGQLE